MSKDYRLIGEFETDNAYQRKFNGAALFRWKNYDEIIECPFCGCSEYCRNDYYTLDNPKKQYTLFECPSCRKCSVFEASAPFVWNRKTVPIIYTDPTGLFYVAQPQKGNYYNERKDIVAFIVFGAGELAGIFEITDEGLLTELGEEIDADYYNPEFPEEVTMFAMETLRGFWMDKFYDTGRRRKSR